MDVSRLPKGPGCKVQLGSVGLAYLYRSMDNVTRRTEATCDMCGFVWGLSIWMWERIPVGRPKKADRRPWMDYGEDNDKARHPTVAYGWERVKVYTGKSIVLYKVFTNELDALTTFQVNWQPYDERQWGFQLNVMCRHDRLLYRCIADEQAEVLVDHRLGREA
ncbi:Serine/threonine-protein phosphatase 7 long form-like protein [Hordeum vulgare]|nr:Serine/threonine-protein phosphatase 7 long form-like protein [Hordeum vulgare]